MKPIARVILKHDDMDESYHMDECLCIHHMDEMNLKNENQDLLKLTT
jgi:hypothetical protein